MSRILTVRLGVAKCFLVRGKEGYLLIDAGTKNKARKLWNFLKKHNIPPQDINLIVVTHGHIDHIGSLAEIREKTRALVIAHKEDKEMLITGQSRPLRGVSKVADLFIRNMGKISMKIVSESVEPDVVIEGDFSLEEYGFEAKILYTPGHTLGSISVLLKTGELFVGDFSMGFPMKLRPGLPLIVENKELLFKSWKRVAEEEFELIYQAHGRVFKKKRFDKIVSGLQ